MKDQLNENSFDAELPPFDFDEVDRLDQESKNKKEEKSYRMRRSIEDRMEEKRLHDLIKDWDEDLDEGLDNQ